MAEFKPKINQPLEGVEHARWLERQREKDRKELAAIRAEQSRQAQNTASLGRRTIRTRATAQTSSGLPDGGTTGTVLRKLDSSNGHATWSTEWLGLMPEYWVSLDAAGASYFVSPMSLLEDEAADADLAKTLLPEVQIDADGVTMYPIDFNNFPDAVGSGAFVGAGQAPFHLYVEVNPSFEGEEFWIYLPTPDNLYGTVTPFYTFHLVNIGAYGATVNIEGTKLFYAGTVIPVNGTTGAWDYPSGYGAAWTVSNVRGWGTAVTPVTSLSEISDEWYEANVLWMRRHFTVPKDGALSVATIPRRIYNDTVSDLTIGKVTASVGTAPSGVDLTLVVKKNGTSVTTSFAVTAGTNTGTAVLSDTAWAVGDYLTIEVTQTGSAADLNVQIWAG